jgi:cell wall-associated NlpC family hydrolase
VDGGANCQQYAYTVLRHYGFLIPDFRSSDLWEDHLHTRTASSLVPFDLVLVHSQPQSYGEHVGVYVGEGLVLHLTRQIDAPSIETLGELQSREHYRHAIGFKTVLSRQVND